MASSAPSLSGTRQWRAARLVHWRSTIGASTEPREVLAARRDYLEEKLAEWERRGQERYTGPEHRPTAEFAANFGTWDDQLVEYEVLCAVVAESPPADLRLPIDRPDAGRCKE